MTRDLGKPWVLAAVLWVPCAAAATNDPPASLMPCFEMAAARYDLPVALLVAIASVESNFDPQASNANKNGSRDIGIMQINSSWFARLEQAFRITEDALWLPCTNVMVGSWILAQNIADHGATWKAVGAYNARSTHKRERYVALVKKRMAQWGD